MAGELGRGSVENLASEPSEPADGLLIESLSMTFTADDKTAKITSDFLFFSCNLETNHTKMEKCLLIFAANTNVLIPSAYGAGGYWCTVRAKTQ